MCAKLVSLASSGCGSTHGIEADMSTRAGARAPLTKMDSRYYAIPPTNAPLWADFTSADLEFNVKAFRLFTGLQTDPKVL